MNKKVLVVVFLVICTSSACTTPLECMEKLGDDVKKHELIIAELELKIGTLFSTINKLSTQIEVLEEGKQLYLSNITSL